MPEAERRGKRDPKQRNDSRWVSLAKIAYCMNSSLKRDALKLHGFSLFVADADTL